MFQEISSTEMGDNQKGPFPVKQPQMKTWMSEVSQCFFFTRKASTPSMMAPSSSCK